MRKDYGYAIRKNQYDKYGRTIFRRYYGIEGEPVINSEDHCAGWGYWYDEKGNETDVWYVVLHPVSNNTLQCWKNMLYSIKNGIGGHRYATLHCHAGLWQVIADELIRLEVVDYITDTTVCEVMKKTKSSRGP